LSLSFGKSDIFWVVILPRNLRHSTHLEITVSNLNTRDVYTSQWKFVQVLAEQFWSRWRREYLQTLQSRRKWRQTQENIQEGDLVILKDGDQHRNIWPLGLIEHVCPSDDNLVRKVLIRTIIDGQPRICVRPITDCSFAS
jgi:putative ribosome biogenesis GTPase RsgA